MPVAMQCPFFKRENNLKIHCEGGTLKFLDAVARREFVFEYCSHPFGWEKCSIARCLKNYYDRKDEN